MKCCWHDDAVITGLLCQRPADADCNWCSNDRWRNANTIMFKWWHDYCCKNLDVPNLSLLHVILITAAITITIGDEMILTWWCNDNMITVLSTFDHVTVIDTLMIVTKCEYHDVLVMTWRLLPKITQYLLSLYDIPIIPAIMITIGDEMLLPWWSNDEGLLRHKIIWLWKLLSIICRSWNTATTILSCSDDRG